MQSRGVRGGRPTGIADPYSRGSFLDGAAQCAQEASVEGTSPVRLERAWRAVGGTLGLARWLGAAGSRASLRESGPSLPWTRARRSTSRSAPPCMSCPETFRRPRSSSASAPGGLGLVGRGASRTPALPGNQALLITSSFAGGEPGVPPRRHGSRRYGGGVACRRGGLRGCLWQMLRPRLQGRRTSGRRRGSLPPRSPQLLSRAGVRGVTDVATRRAEEVL